jgi:hypothetical protein
LLRDDLADFLRDCARDVALQFAVFSHILAFEPELLLLHEILPSHCANFVKDVEQHWFWRSASIGTPS